MRQRWPVRRRSYYGHAGRGISRRRYVSCVRARCPKHHRTGRGLRIVVLLVCVVGVLIVINEQLKPMLQSSVAQQAGQVSVQAVNQAVQKVLEANPLSADYLEVKRDSNGEIQSIDTDTQTISQLKTKLNLQIQQSLGSLDRCSLGIPLGTLIGGNLFRGLGPNVYLRFTVASNAYCDMVSKFDSAGVNQTRHVLSLVVSTEVYAMIPGFDTKTTTETTFPVAETIIVGKVPNLYWSANSTSLSQTGTAQSSAETEGN